LFAIMFELIWKKTGFEISRRHAGAPQPVSSAGYAEIELATWKEYMQTGRTMHEPIQEYIHHSWQRCLEIGVDPASGKCRDIRPPTALTDADNRLCELGNAIQTDIYGLIRGQNLLITICDRNGYLISMGGDYRPLLAADKLNFGPGANWSEKSVGTNAIGTALATGRPMRVAGREHFCESHHRWVCSAAPIFDIDGQIMGCIDISGPKSAHHDQALALAVKGARIIESRLYRSRIAHLETWSQNLLDTLFSAVMTGLIYLTPHGHIVSANTNAAILLGLPAEQLSGVDAGRWFDIPPALFDPCRLTGQGVPLTCRRHPKLRVTALPITSPNQTPAGILLVVCEQQTAHTHAPPPVPADDAFGAIIGRSSAMHQAIDDARRIAPTDATVLITGESGTGKEIFAQALHRAGPRAGHPFVAVNCGAIAPDLIQSDLFGYTDGAFTGARRGGNVGKFEQASGGTLFLDEIGEMPLAMQVNLLRVLEDKMVMRVGGKRARAVDVRLIAATNQNLEQRMQQGAFRQDLFFRLNVIRIKLPPLRKRDGDIARLAQHFIGKLSRQFKRPIRQIEADIYPMLEAYCWPGNVRELRNVLEAAILLMRGDVLQADSLPEHLRSVTPEPPTGFNLDQIQKQAIQNAYQHYHGNITNMAKALGIGRNTLYAKMKKYDIEK